MISIVLVDDHHVVREALRVLLEVEPDFRVVGETDDGLEAVRLVTRVRPDVLVLDLMLPGLHGLEVLRNVRKETPKTRPIVLSMHTNETYVQRALENGALGYVLKSSSSMELVRAIREVAAGRRYLCSRLSAVAIKSAVEHVADIALKRYELLTTREREVLQLIAEGYTNVQIAKRLFLSPRTVETHRAHLMRKLGLRRHAELIHYALRLGIIPHEPD